jgi:hypothetical protein
VLLFGGQLQPTMDINNGAFGLLHRPVLGRALSAV